MARPPSQGPTVMPMLKDETLKAGARVGPSAARLKTRLLRVGLVPKPKAPSRNTSTTTGTGYAAVRASSIEVTSSPVMPT